MDAESLLKNRPVPQDIFNLVAARLTQEEKALFAIVGDMNLQGRYDTSLMLFTSRRVFVADKCADEGMAEFEYRDLKNLKVRRMYGNACICANTGGRHTVLFRYTYSIAALCDMACDFINAIQSGEELGAQMQIVAAVFEKALSVCPKCGRNLIRAGAECIMCRSKSKIAGKLLKYIAPQKSVLIFCVFLSLITTAMTLVPPFITKTMVDDIIPGKNMRMLTVIIACLFLSYVIQHAVGALRGYLMRAAGDKIVAELRNDIYQKVQRLPMKFYDKTSTGSVINRISGDSATLQQFMLRITQEVVVQLFLLIGIVVIMFALNWRLTLLSLIPVPLVAIGARIFGKKIKPYYKRIWRRWSAVTSLLADSIPCIRIIKSFAGEDRATKKFRLYNNEWLKVDLKSAKISTIFPNIVSLVIACGSLAIWAVGGHSAIVNPAGEISVGLLVAFISYTTMFYGPVNFFANLSDSYQGALVSTERILDILEAEPESEVENGFKPDIIRGKIEFRNVNFSFDRTKKVLSGINLTIEPGDVVGIVGTTGSGKSTLINLLMCFYDTYEGEILVDDIDLREYDVGHFRSKIGYVQQEPMMFSDTIFNNIAYGTPDAQIETVIHAADVANAHGFIARLPDAYDTILGERGVGISGGEKQRLSIARAVLKNPNILIFDEATAAVDSETESLIQQAIDRLISGRTTLMIAHRLSTLRKANKIVVVDAGRIIETGSHEELMQLKGKYHKLIQIQSMSEQAERSREAEKL